MTVRQAGFMDLKEIWQLGQGFGHLMTYMRTEKGIEPHLKEMIVKVDDQNHMSTGEVLGFFHCRPLVDKVDVDFVLQEKTIPDFLMDSAWYRSLNYMNNFQGPKKPVGICMQGGSHREVFAELIQYLQTQFSELWCWCSIKSRRPEGYKELGFSFNPQIHYTFHNPHVDRESTYQLGRWVSEQ